MKVSDTLTATRKQGFYRDTITFEAFMTHFPQLSHLSNETIKKVGTDRICALFHITVKMMKPLIRDLDNSTILNYALQNVRERNKRAPIPSSYAILDFPAGFIDTYPEIAKHALYAKRQEMKLFGEQEMHAANKITSSELRLPNYRDPRTGAFIHHATFKRFQANGWAKISKRAPFRVILTPLARKKIDEYNVANGLEPVTSTRSRKREENRWSLTDCLKACKTGLPLDTTRFETVIIEAQLLKGKIVRDPFTQCFILKPKAPREPRRAPPTRSKPLGVHLRTKLENARLGTLQRRHWGKLAARDLIDINTGLLTPAGEKALAT